MGRLETGPSLRAVLAAFTGSVRELEPTAELRLPVHGPSLRPQVLLAARRPAVVSP